MTTILNSEQLAEHFGRKYRAGPRTIYTFSRNHRRGGRWSFASGFVSGGEYSSLKEAMLVAHRTQENDLAKA